MNYIKYNYSLLAELDGYLRLFPFSKKEVKSIRTIDLKAVKSAYAKHTDLEEDIVANAIYWSVCTLENLLDKKPVSTLDEVLSFTDSVLNENQSKE